jgi:3-hydroxyacyl-CoA dehydrogenase/enoyl-CoA hydratase/carnithine racemase
LTERIPKDNDMAYFTIEMHDDVAVVWLDQPDSPVNVLSLSMLDEFKSLLDEIENNQRISGAVLISRKPDCFIAGADIKEFLAMQSSEEAEQLSRDGNALLLRLEKLNKPVIAAMNGATLGGGLEVAMACHYRIASTDKKTVFGLPEVKLGLLPGGGGTQRTPRLVGLRNALDMLLTGKNVYPHKARKIGLVDELIHKEGLLQAAIASVKENRRHKPRKKSLLDKALEDFGPGRNFVLKKARETVLRKTRGNYPAPLKILECVETGLEYGFEAGIECEIKAFAELHGTEACQNLVRLFLDMQDNKKLKNPEKGLPVETVGMIGAGFMGSGITEVSIRNGYDVVLKDISLENLGRGLKTIWRDLDKLVRRRAMLPVERDRLMARIKTTLNDEDLAASQLVIEAVFEDLDLKRKILASTEAVIRDDTVFASNTSSLPIAEIARDAKRPENVLGMHYFSPVPKMPLLELVVTDKTSDKARQTAINVGIDQGKTVVVVHDGPGFYTTRILSALTHEAMRVIAEGVSIEDVDNAMKDWGFPVGPAALLDEVGIDVAAHIAKGALGEMFLTRGIEADDTPQKLAEAGLLGRKAGKGFYLYPKKGRKTVNTAIYRYFGGEERKAMDKKEIQDRIALAMINEAMLCLQEGIIAHAKDGDLAAILGLGFPPFRGGPFRYVDRVGAETILKRLQEFEGRYGVRFKPAEILVEYAKNGKKFRPDD